MLSYIKRAVRAAVLLLMPLLAAACVDVEEYDNSATGNIEALWSILDQHYCYFQEKQEQYGVDWNEVRTRYMAAAGSVSNRYELFELMSNMLAELHDGHVNMSAAFDVARNWSWKENYPANFSDSLLRRYLGTDYRIASGIYYRRLSDNVGYMYVPTFDSELGEGNLDEVMLHLMPCSAVIVDVRDNGGGKLTEARKLAARFCDERTLVGYMCHKTGTGHNDFSAREEQWLAPSSNVRCTKDVYLLTNRGVYSAANEFVKYMKRMPRVTVVGDKTGGGSGMPYSSELPCGWSVRFSACPMFDAEGNSTEGGVEPDVSVSITSNDYQRSVDTLIETARRLANMR